MNLRKKKLGCLSTLFLFAIAMFALPQFAAAQDGDDQYDDPPDRVARLGYLEGSVSMQPAGEPDWVGAVSNRPITSGDKLWSDQDSRAEVELGSAVIRLSANTGFSFLNLDDRTTQIELTAGVLNIRVRRLDQNDLFEIDTPNQAFSIFRPGNYRIEASEDGTYTVISVRDGEGESTGNGQTYTLHAGQRGTFSGTDSLRAEVDNIGGSDQFDNWCSTRDGRYDNSRSASYVSRDVVGYEDLDDNGDWRDESDYGHVWYPTRVAVDWAPYRDGHWAWISPWGWTWIDDAPWGYAPFHYGRWVTIRGRWGWIAGPIAVRPVYAPALVVFIGGGGFGVNVGWFPLGPREVYVPSYRVSRGYVNRVNISNTTVNVTNITNVYNTTIINKTTNITNVNYVNRNVRGGVTAVSQRTFVSAQPVGRARVSVNAREISSATMTARVAVAPTRDSVLGRRANTVNRVTAPPPAVARRQVIAKTAPPPSPVPFARQQAELQKRPGEALSRREVQTLRPAAARDNPHPMVKMAPAGKPATPIAGRPGNQPNQPGGQPRGGRPDQPDNRPGNDARPNDNRPADNRPANNNRPDRNSNDRPSAATPGQPDRADADKPNRPNNRPDSNPNERPGAANPGQPNRADADNPNRPNNRPDSNPNERPSAANPGQPDRPAAEKPNQPNNRPDNNRPDSDRPAANRADNKQPANNRPAGQPDRAPVDRTERPNANRPSDQPESRPSPPEANQPNNRPDRPTRNDRSSDAKPDRPTDRSDRPAPAPRPQTQEEKKQQQQQEKKQQQEKQRQEREQQQQERDKRNEKPPAS